MNEEWQRDDAERRFMWFTLLVETVRWAAQIATPVLLAILIWKLWI